MRNEVAILINTKDRPTELALLLQSLRTQTFQGFDVFIMDDASGSHLMNYHFFNCVINRLKVENHLVFMMRTEFSEGVNKARQKIVDWALPFGYKYFARVDDDVVLERDYLERLMKVIDEGYDLASGVTVPMLTPVFKRDPKYLKGVINRIVLDEKGNYIFNGDDCGIEYTHSEILPCHHFRSCALYKTEIHEKANYMPTRLSKHGFREEQIFSYRILMSGFKMGVDTGAVNYHQMTPSGGERSTTNFTGYNQERFEEFTREHKDELPKEFFENPLTEKELLKTTNLRVVK